MLKVGATQRIAQQTTEVAPASLQKALIPLAPLVGLEKPSVSMAPICRVQVSGLGADILLPATGPDAFGAYLARLEKSNTFPDHRPTLAKLAALPVAEGKSLGGPRVGILVSDPADLFTHEAEDLKAIIAELRALGADPLLIPPRADLLLSNPKQRAAGMQAMIQGLEGIVGPGGDDVHPRIYAQRNRYSEDINYPRDRFEADFAMMALAKDVYLLGICRSHQLWNAASGGDLVQDVQAEGYSSISQRQKDYGIPLDRPFVLWSRGKVQFENRVELERSSRMAAATGSEAILTNSSHHQAVRSPGAPFRAVGVVKDDVTGKNTIEACEAPNAFTVQWHPELQSNPLGKKLFEALVRRATIFGEVKRLRADGPVKVAQLLDWMRQDGRFDAVDFEWVKKDLTPRL